MLAVYRKPIPGYPMLTEPSVLVFYQPNFLPAGLLRAVRAAASGPPAFPTAIFFTTTSSNPSAVSVLAVCAATLSLSFCSE